jgi:ketosteroid isomerase-like protein
MRKFIEVVGAMEDAGINVRERYWSDDVEWYVPAPKWTPPEMPEGAIAMMAYRPDPSKEGTTRPEPPDLVVLVEGVEHQVATVRDDGGRIVVTLEPWTSGERE